MLAELKLTQVTGLICRSAGDPNPVLGEFKVLVFPFNFIHIFSATLDTYLEIVLKHVCFQSCFSKETLK